MGVVTTTLTTKSDPGDTMSVWTLTQDKFTLVTRWSDAITYLHQSIRSGEADAEDIILAGPHGTPWILDYYLIAAECVKENDRSGVFDAFGKNAALLVDEYGEMFRDALSAPWANAH